MEDNKKRTREYTALVAALANTLCWLSRGGSPEEGRPAAGELGTY
jgi:hypothetical protein